MKNPKENESAQIIQKLRPLFGLSEEELCAMLMHAEFLAEKAEEQGADTISAKLIMLTAHKMMCDVGEEIAQRN